MMSYLRTIKCKKQNKKRTEQNKNRTRKEQNRKRTAGKKTGQKRKGTEQENRTGEHKKQEQKNKEDIEILYWVQGAGGELLHQGKCHIDRVRFGIYGIAQRLCDYFTQQSIIWEQSADTRSITHRPRNRGACPP